MRGDVIMKGGGITVCHISRASKEHTCGSCGGPIRKGERYERQETVVASNLTTHIDEPNFWRKWGRVPHGDKEVGIFHASESECAEWLYANSVDVP